jgi:hypothetical protein
MTFICSRRRFLRTGCARWVTRRAGETARQGARGHADFSDGAGGFGALCDGVREREREAKLDIHDKTTGARLRVNLAGQHAAAAFVGKRERAVVAKYGF